jgi:hypothetical protein
VRVEHDNVVGLGPENSLDGGLVGRAAAEREAVRDPRVVDVVPLVEVGLVQDALDGAEALLEVEDERLSAGSLPPEERLASNDGGERAGGQGRLAVPGVAADDRAATAPDERAEQLVGPVRIREPADVPGRQNLDLAYGGDRRIGTSPSGPDPFACAPLRAGWELGGNPTGRVSSIRSAISSLIASGAPSLGSPIRARIAASSRARGTARPEIRPS